jgi:SAM-dependent methyltransferase
VATDAENQAVFRSAEVVSGFTDYEGWLDHGERMALLEVAPRARGGAVLDIGVGAGRTASILKMLTDLCRRLHPDVEVSVGDARELTPFRDASLSLVFFSNNGIDAVDEPGRRRILAEMHRVLDNDGALVMCTPNKDGRSYGERPWQLHRPGQPADRSPKKYGPLVLDDGQRPDAGAAPVPELVRLSPGRS